jgi:hypothetical protein
MALSQRGEVCLGWWRDGVSSFEFSFSCLSTSSSLYYLFLSSYSRPTMLSLDRWYTHPPVGIPTAYLYSPSLSLLPIFALTIDNDFH